MVGADVLAQVREALANPYSAMGEENAREALAAFDGCIVLTAEEAENVRMCLATKTSAPMVASALALLTPKEQN